MPGRPLFFATTLTQGGFGVGVLAESHEGRPTKIEGNTEHPASLGSTDMFAQAAILDLYDPARSQSVLHDGGAAMASTFLVAVAQLLRAKQATGGQGVRLLTGAVTSPTFALQMKAFAALYPNARWHRWEPAGPLCSRAAAVRAFGRPVEARYDLSHADVIAAFDSDFLAAGPGSVPYARQFADRRRVREASPELPQKMNRLYAVETTPSPTGSIADHRLPLPPAELEALLLALARQVGVAGAPAAAPAHYPTAYAPDGLSAKAQAFLEALAADLLAHPGASLVVAGETTSPAAQVLAHAINAKLGNAGKTVIYAEPAEIDPVDHLQSLAELVRDMRAGQVDLLIMLGGVNPVYTAPADLDFAAALPKVATRIHHGLYVDETAEYCHWHVPAAHDLECWGDARAFDGTASLAQPLIEPLYGGRSLQEVMAVLLGHGEALGYDLVRATWNGQLPGDFEAAWRKALHDGVIPGTQLPPLGGAAVAGAAVARAAGEIAAAQTAAQATPAAAGAYPGGGRQLTLCFQPDPTIGDGSWASNVWLQELPKPMTKLTWDNAVLISPATHQRLGLDWEERVRVSVNGRKLDAAVWVLPGQADDTLTLSLGYGRRRAGENGSGLGFNAYVLRTAATPWSAPGRRLESSGHHQGSRRALHLRLHPEPSCHRPGAGHRRGPVGGRGGREAPRPAHRDARRIHAGPRLRRPSAAWRRGAAARHDPVPQPQVRGALLGDGDRPQRLHRLQRLRRRLPGREQHPGRGQGPGDAAPRDALDPRRPLLHRRHGRPAAARPAGPLHAVRERPLRAGLPGRRHGAQRRGAERHDLQPLRRHPLLLEQLPLQSPALQLPALQRRQEPAGGDDVQPGRDGAHARRDGEVHLLRAAHRARQDRLAGERPADRGAAPEDRLPAGVPDPGDRLRRPQRREVRRPGGRGLALEGQPAQLRHARRPQHPAADHLPGAGPQPAPAARPHRRPREDDLAWPPWTWTGAPPAGSRRR